MVAWGDFESMALHYIKLLASPIHRDPIWIEDGDGGSYGVCSYKEYVELLEKHGVNRHRLVSTMTRVEFMGLLLARYKDFFPEDEDAVEKKDISTGEQPSDKSATLDAGGNRGPEGGHGAGIGGQPEKDSNRTVH